MVRDGVGRSFKRKSKSQLKTVGSLIKEAKRAISNGNYSMALVAELEAQKAIEDTKRLAKEMKTLKDREKQNSHVRIATKVVNAVNAKERKLQTLESNLDKAEAKTRVNNKSKKKVKNNETVELELKNKYD